MEELNILFSYLIIWGIGIITGVYFTIHIEKYQNKNLNKKNQKDLINKMNIWRKEKLYNNEKKKIK
jgi:hypothetical protein